MIVFKLFFKALSLLPLRALHLLGALLGRLTYALSGQYAARMRENLRQAGFGQDKAVLSASIDEVGKSILELPWVWARPYDEVLASVLDCQGMQHLEAARASGKSIIFLTPHLGCFEMTSLYLAQKFPITVLYRPPRLAWLEEVMCNGRRRGQARLAKADLSGVRLLFKALKRGEAIGLLPDQVPSGGEGVWADFFGRPAYTMTLVGRLAEASDSRVMLVSAERQAGGYVIHFEPLALDFSSSVPRQINDALEKMIRAYPSQYLWSYNRYKVPGGVLPAEKES